jgi:hypothetical protein
MAARLYDNGGGRIQKEAHTQNIKKAKKCQNFFFK